MSILIVGAGPSGSHLAQILAINGRALLSGMLISQIPRLKVIFQSLGWLVSSTAEKDSWGLMEISGGRTEHEWHIS